MFEVFPYIFSSVFNTVANNREFIDNVVDSIMNNETFNNIVNNLENVANMAQVDIDFKEYKTAYILESYLPGVDKKDINLDYENNYITLEIKRNQFFENDSKTVFAVISNGSDIMKDFYVENINQYNIKAVFKNNILRVYIPKNDKIDKETTIIEVSDYS